MVGDCGLVDKPQTAQITFPFLGHAVKCETYRISTSLAIIAILDVFFTDQQGFDKDGTFTPCMSPFLISK